MAANAHSVFFLEIVTNLVLVQLGQLYIFYMLYNYASF